MQKIKVNEKVKVYRLQGTTLIPVSNEWHKTKPEAIEEMLALHKKNSYSDTYTIMTLIDVES